MENLESKWKEKDKEESKVWYSEEVKGKVRRGEERRGGEGRGGIGRRWIKEREVSVNEWVNESREIEIKKKGER